MSQEDASRKYLKELQDLKCNSKPVINLLTMMAEDFIVQAVTIVHVIEHHLKIVKPELKLPTLYLIDSIVKNVKKDYLKLFNEKIVKIFTDTFSQVSEKVRTQMWKLRNTWNDVFPSKTLQMIDFRCHEIDPGWPAPKNSSGPSIHVNPAFLRNATALKPPTVLSTPTLPSTGYVLDLPLEADASLREKYLLQEKEKELLELRTKKLELELLQAKLKLQMRDSQSQPVIQTTIDTDSKQSLLLQQAELAKQKTGIATSLLSSGGNATRNIREYPSVVATKEDAEINLPVLEDPRLRRENRDTVKLETEHARSPILSSPDNSPVKLSGHSSEASSQSKKATSHVSESKSVISKRRAHTPEQPTDDVNLISRPLKSSPASKALRVESPPPRKGASPTKDAASRASVSPGDARKRKHDIDSGYNSSQNSDRKRVSRERSTSESESGGRSGGSRKSSGSSKEDANGDSYEIPSKRRRKRSRERSAGREEKGREKEKDDVRYKREDHIKKEKSKTAGRYGRGHTARDGDEKSAAKKVGAGKHTVEIWEARKREKDDYKARKEEVLKKSYKKKPTDTKSENTPPKLKSDSMEIEEHDIRGVDVSTHQKPEMKSSSVLVEKSKRGSAPDDLIDDLFGREDVDLRAQPPTVPGSTWSQIKKSEIRHIGGATQVFDVDTTLKIEDGSRDEDIRKILSNQIRPPAPLSPANSIDSNRSNCDALGRPFLYKPLPDDPMERKRSLDQRSVSIDPLEKFRSKFIEDPSLSNGGELNESDLKIAFHQAKLELDRGGLNKEQHEAIMRQLMQINEVNKIRELQKQQERVPLKPANQESNPWATADNGWNGSRPPPIGFGSRGRDSTAVGPNWGEAGVNWPRPPQPVGPNPFEIAAAGDIGMPPRMDLLPPPNMMEVETARRDTCGTIPIDDVLRQVRFYGTTAIVVQGPLGEEPREISFRKCEKNVFVDDECLRCLVGKEKELYLDRNRHFVRIGAPTRELYIGTFDPNSREIIQVDHYEARFGGPPIRVRVGRYMHSVRLEGPPPQVEIGRRLRYDLLAGRVNIFIDGNLTCVYLDEKPQLLDLGGFVVVFRFCDEFSKVLLNGMPFCANFGGAPWSVSVPGGRTHYLRLGGLNPVTIPAMNQFVAARRSEFVGGFRGTRGGPRGRGQRGGRGRHMPPSGKAPFETPMDVGPFNASKMDGNNPLDLYANFSMHIADELNTSMEKSEHSYEIDKSALVESGAEGDKQSETASEAPPVDIQDLLSKLMQHGILPSVGAPKSTDQPAVEKTESVVPTAIVPSEKSEVKPSASVKDVVEVTWEKLKDRRPKLIETLCVGVQCATCGLRYPPDQNVKYSEHLQWHFQQNRRAKRNAQKAVSRKWYYDLSDWLQFVEIEDLEERAQSLFGMAEPDLEGEQRSPGTVLNPDAYTVLSSGFEDAICPGCNEGFESYFDEEKEEWRLRDAVLVDIEGAENLYHPICHQDLIAAMDGKSSVLNAQEPPVVSAPEPVAAVEPMEIEKPEADPYATDDDEVLIIKEGKPEPVIMDIDLEEDQPIDPSGSCNQVENNKADDQSLELETNELKKDVQKDSVSQNENENIEYDANGIDNLAPTAQNNKTNQQSSSVRETDIAASVLHANTGELSKSVSVDKASEDELRLSLNSYSSTSHVISSRSPQTPVAVDEETSDVLELDLFGSGPTSGIFDIALQNHRPMILPPDEDSMEKRIVYASMKFDNPTPVIKMEPIDPEDLPSETEPQTLDELIRAQTVSADDDGEPKKPVEDIDLTADDEDPSENTARMDALSALEGNVLVGGTMDVYMPKKILSASKLQFRLPDSFGTSSQSPKGSPVPEGSGSPKPAKDTTSESLEEGLVKTAGETAESSSPTSNNGANSPGEEAPKVDENETKRLESLKPRFKGRKLVNYPPKQCGKETSGLCTIC